jgi:hypothetical protein
MASNPPSLDLEDKVLAELGRIASEYNKQDPTLAQSQPSRSSSVTQLANNVDQGSSDSMASKFLASVIKRDEPRRTSSTSLNGFVKADTPDNVSRVTTVDDDYNEEKERKRREERRARDVERAYEEVLLPVIF